MQLRFGQTNIGLKVVEHFIVTFLFGHKPREKDSPAKFVILTKLANFFLLTAMGR